MFTNTDTNIFREVTQASQLVVNIVQLNYQNTGVFYCLIVIILSFQCITMIVTMETKSVVQKYCKCNL